MRSCGECSYQTRTTACDGGCTDWSACDQLYEAGTQPINITDGCNGDEYRDYECTGTSPDATYTVIVHNDPDGDGFDECSDCDQTDATINPGADEICDGRDNDCNGEIDEDLSAPQASLHVGVCRDAVKICDGTNGWIEPDYTAIDGYESSETTCDGLDNDCDGTQDEGMLTSYYPDSDGDSYGRDADVVDACSKPAGYTTLRGDCDDTDATIKPGATEVCDAVDNDCDGSINEGLLHEGPLNPKQDGICSGSQQSCNATTTDWYVDYSGGILIEYEGDSEESCDLLDNDCDGTIDEDVKTSYYYDGDRDGIGRQSASYKDCSPMGFYDATEYGDCDDSVASCTTDCTTQLYNDSDGDGFGTTAVTHRACDAPASYINVTGDCNDNEVSINPNASETCDGLDNDCSGSVDDGWESYPERSSQPNTNQEGVCSGSLKQCENGSWVDWYDIQNIPDYQSSEYAQDGLDNDCDGITDEGLLPVENLTCEEDHPIPGTLNCTFDNPLTSTAENVTLYYTYFTDTDFNNLQTKDRVHERTISLSGAGTYSFMIEDLKPSVDTRLYLFSDAMQAVNATIETTTGGVPQFGQILNLELFQFNVSDGTPAALVTNYSAIAADTTVENNRFQAIVKGYPDRTYLYAWIQSVDVNTIYFYETDSYYAGHVIE
jgi:hypothetical protein